MHNITIRPVLNGFVCKVGCSEVVFENIKSLLVELEKYLEDPPEREKHYRENAINAKWIDRRNPPLDAPPHAQTGGSGGLVGSRTARRSEEAAARLIERGEPGEPGD